MLLGGLWHGASWTFVVWGGLHGSALAIHKLWMHFVGPRIPSTLRPVTWPFSWAVTFVFVLVTWVFFRAPDFATAWAFLDRMVAPMSGGIAWYRVEALVVLALGAGIHGAVVLRRDRDLELDLRRPEMVAAALGLALLVFLYAPFGVSPFIYFQF
jgi:alginate O-acetyltransferase complex protein AlgI